MNKTTKEYTWGMIHHLCLKLTYEIRLGKAININYNYIHPIPRGGLVPATILSHALEIPIEVEWNKILNKNKSDVLIVDDIVDSGNTIQHYSDYDVACVFYKPDVSIVRPTYYSQIAKSEDWIVFPWECTVNDSVSSVNKD